MSDAERTRGGHHNHNNNTGGPLALVIIAFLCCLPGGGIAYYFYSKVRSKEWTMQLYYVDSIIVGGNKEISFFINCKHHSGTFGYRSWNRCHCMAGAANAAHYYQRHRILNPIQI